jgi:hypothetical protein
MVLPSNQVKVSLVRFHDHHASSMCHVFLIMYHVSCILKFSSYIIYHPSSCQQREHYFVHLHHLIYVMLLHHLDVSSLLTSATASSFCHDQQRHHFHPCMILRSIMIFSNFYF